jgi:hypothetical protein
MRPKRMTTKAGSISATEWSWSFGIKRGALEAAEKVGVVVFGRKRGALAPRISPPK